MKREKEDGFCSKLPLKLPEDFSIMIIQCVALNCVNPVERCTFFVLQVEE